MATTTTNKRKKAVAATVAAAALLLAGTFAWTSISQQALNETIVDINPGGRLHDDFNGTNKDVYVENFGDNVKGVPIYARIRLDEYVELGPEAGMRNIGDDTRNAEAIGRADLALGKGDEKTWQTYKPGEDSLQSDGNISDEYWTLTFGNGADNKPYYIPTFNKNKDSLEPDINGTYEGTVDGDIVHYDDYVEYDQDSAITGTEVEDWDDNTIDEGDQAVAVTDPANNPFGTTGFNIKETPNQTHKAEQVDYAANVITMAQWQEMLEAAGGYDAEQHGSYWVYDTDGWAYWTQPILPGETTGLFLDGVSMTKTPDENWYYGINVVGQFATSGDLNAFTMNGETITNDAASLLDTVIGMGERIVIDTADGDFTVEPGGSVDLTAKKTVAGIQLQEQPEITWTLTDKDGNAVDEDVAKITTTTDEDGNVTATVTVAEDVEPGTEFTITAEVKGSDPVLKAEQKITVAEAPYTVRAYTVDGNLQPELEFGVYFFAGIAENLTEDMTDIQVDMVFHPDNQSEPIAYPMEFTNKRLPESLYAWISPRYVISREASFDMVVTYQSKADGEIYGNKDTWYATEISEEDFENEFASDLAGQVDESPIYMEYSAPETLIEDTDFAQMLDASMEETINATSLELAYAFVMRFSTDDDFEADSINLPNVKVAVERIVKTTDASGNVTETSTPIRILYAPIWMDSNIAGEDKDLIDTSGSYQNGAFSMAATILWEKQVEDTGNAWKITIWYEKDGQNYGITRTYENLPALTIGE